MLYLYDGVRASKFISFLASITCPSPSLMAASEPASKNRGFRRTLLAVMTVQVLALLILWLLQLRYHV